VKIVWLSPEGDGWSLAYKLREQGEKVVYWNPTNENGAGYLPKVTDAAWVDYARKADVVVCDATPPSRKTRRSWEPSELSFALQELRHHGVPVIGPTPTTELVENDPRYQRKTLRRFGLLNAAGLHPIPSARPPQEPVQVTISREPFGTHRLLFRETATDGNHVSVALPIQAGGLVNRTTDLLENLLRRVGHSTHVNLHAVLTESDLYVTGVSMGFLYPDICAQLGDLLVAWGVVNGVQEGAPNQEPPSAPTLAVTLFQNSEQPPRALDELLDEPGVFGAEVHAPDGDRMHTQAHGLILGALVGRDHTWGELTSKVYRETNRLALRYGAQSFLDTAVLDDIPVRVQKLHEWGYLA